MQEGRAVSTGRPQVQAPPLPEAFVDALRAALRGTVTARGDDGYEDARQVYNGMIQRHPGAVAQVADVADIMTCVNAARDAGVTVAVRGGAHNAAGLGTIDGGLVIDLGHLKGIRVDPQARTVRVEPGCVWGDVDHATHPFGLAVPCGIVGSTGVAGLTLGGGTGYLTRAHGLTIDNLLSADVVLADGSLVTASADEHPDLFWAIRGGGGNFGIVTSFLFRAHPVKNIIGGPTFWDIKDAAAVFSAYQDFIQGAPEHHGSFFAFHAIPPVPLFPEHLHGRIATTIIWCHNGPKDEFDRLVKPVLDVAEPLMHGAQEMPFPMLNSFFDPLLPAGMQWYWRADYMPKLNSDAIQKHATYGATLPTPLSLVHIYPVNGAPQRVAPDATAHRHRDAMWSQVIIGVDPDPGKADELRDWAVDYHDALHPHSTVKGGYVNFMMEEGADRIQATYGANYDRLRQIKRRYDPDNFFHVNQNIPPAA